MWNASVYEKLNLKRQEAFQGGGTDRIAKQHARGKLTARERLDILFDNGEYCEINQLNTSRSTDFNMQDKKVAGDGVVTAYGYVNGRLVCAVSQDFTVLGGSGGEEYALKMCSMLKKAIDWKCPFININDSGGARIEEGINALSAYSKLFRLNSIASGYIPQIAAIMGPCAGGAAYSPGLCDFVFMVEKSGQMYLTGPAVIKVSTGEDITAEELGGAKVHMQKSGVAHFSYKNDESCIEGIKKLLMYLPSNCEEISPIVKGRSMDLSKGLDEVVSENQRLAYDMRAVLGAYLDKRSFFEIQRDFARNILVGFGRLEGKCVGIVANQPRYMGGVLDSNSADKASRFIRFCDCFNIPILSFVDVPGFYPGKEQEYSGVIRHGAKLLYAFSEATVPKICLVVRKGYGGAYCAMNSKDLGADIVYAWPIAQIAVMGAEGAANIVFRQKIENSQDSEREKVELVKTYEEKFMNPYVAAERGYIDEVILPTETKEKLVFAINSTYKKKENKISKKHDNMPL